jgi:hypothetical protein
MLRNMRVVLAGLLLLVSFGCAGDDDGREELRLYHLETAIGAPGDEGELRCGPPRVACPGIVEQPPPRDFRYAVRSAPALTSDAVVVATARWAADPETGAPVVLVDLTAEGRRAFAGLTRVAARVGGRDQAWHHVAVVVGDEIVGFPEVDYDDHPDGIVGARVLRIAAVSDADARDLVARLRGE